MRERYASRRNGLAEFLAANCERVFRILSAVIALMKAFERWGDFYRALNRALPKQVEAPLFDWLEKEQAKEKKTHEIAEKIERQ
jgi:hypothetical protein